MTDLNRIPVLSLPGNAEPIEHVWTEIGGEEWRSVVGYEGFYEVSSLGRVRSLARIRPNSRHGRLTAPTMLQGHIMAITVSSAGYPCVTVSLGGRARKLSVHTLVAAAFIGPRPEGLIVCHGDNNRRNNVPSNLRYDTHAGNAADQVAAGTAPRGEKNPRSRLTAKQVLWLRRNKHIMTYRKLAEALGVAMVTIQKAITGPNWARLPLADKDQSPQEHEWTPIGENIAEYRGHFVSKTSSGRDWLVLEPAPSKEVFGVFPTIWDAEEAIDAFCDKGIMPSDEEDEEPEGTSTEHLWATTDRRP